MGAAFVPPHIAHHVFPNLVHQHSHSEAWPAELDPADYTVDAAVDRVLKSGAICLKTYVEIRVWRHLRLAVAKPGNAGGSRRGSSPAGPGVCNPRQQRRCVEKFSRRCSADVIAHGLWHWDGDRKASNLTDDALSAISIAASAGVAVQPTMRVVEGERSTLTWDLLNDDRLRHVLSRDLLAFLNSADGRWSQREVTELYQTHNPDPQTAPASLIDSSVNRASASMAKFHASGGRLLFGTDTPAQDGPGNPPGLNGYLELESWARAGIPLADIFRAATLENARMFRLDDRIGTIEAKQAGRPGSAQFKPAQAYTSLQRHFTCHSQRRTDCAQRPVSRTLAATIPAGPCRSTRGEVVVSRKERGAN